MDELTVRRGDGKEPDEKLVKSPITGNTYRVTEWERLGEHKFRAKRVELVQ